MIKVFIILLVLSTISKYGNTIDQGVIVTPPYKCAITEDYSEGLMKFNFE